MIVLQNITDSLEIVLSGAVATNQLPFVATYVDSTTTAYSPLRTTGLTNDTTVVTIVASPAASTSRTIKTISIQNKDTAIITVLVSYNDNGTKYVVLKVTLDIGDNLEYTETNGWKVITTDGAVKLGSTSGGGTWGSITGTLSAQTDLQSALNTKEDVTNKDTSGGYIGLSGWSIKFRNLADTFTSLFQNAATAARIYTFPDKDITVAGIVDIPTKATNTELNTGTDDAKFATALALEYSKYLNQSGSKISAVASGTDTYTATINPAITAYANTQRFFINFTNANTGASTLNLNSLGAKSIKKQGSTALALGDITAGQIMCLAYDGTNFQIVGDGGGGGGIDDEDYLLQASFRSLFKF